MGEKISLTEVPRHLRDKGITTSYNQIWRAACEGRIPAEKHGVRWFVKQDDLPKVAEVFAPAEQ